MSIVTIQTGEIETYQGAETAPLLRTFVSKTYVASNGDTVMQSSFEDDLFYTEIACTVAGEVITYPQFTLHSTTDALSNNGDARYRIDLFTAAGEHIQNLFTGWRIPAEPSLTSLGEIAAYNQQSCNEDDSSEEECPCVWEDIQW